ncbi:glycerophosphodiester phosphodiesterase family protein [Oryzibacter oryziterrae]|uniref:glycerophosphodiester phosphodiesterase family protein n=1 Tax=Oryzibacter oryziterrae TaxID=2766474 RepID=UPI001F30C993|nr:glycerophosphodiester phosphodiesterase family protein [Oryzibacter oryziterrae]
MSDLAWLTARPIAHRGFHDIAAGRVENTMSAFALATERRFNFELDVHLSADGHVVVHHDHELGRLNHGQGNVAEMTLKQLQAVPFKNTTDRICPLQDVLDMVAGRTGIVIEIKSNFAERETEIVRKVATALHDYKGPVVVKSFDTRMIEDLAEIAPSIPRGIVADDAANPADYHGFSHLDQASLAGLSGIHHSKLQFVSYWVKLLPNEISRRVREDWKLPLISWTVRTPEDRARVAEHADQMIFEGFDPEA